MDLHEDILKELKKSNKLKTFDIILKIILIIIVIFSIYFINTKFSTIYNKVNEIDVETLNQKINELDIDAINENLTNLNIITSDLSSIVERLDLSSKVNSSMDTIDNVINKGEDFFNGIKEELSNNSSNDTTQSNNEIQEEYNGNTQEENNFFDSIKDSFSNQIENLTGNKGN